MIFYVGITFWRIDMPIGFFIVLICLGLLSCVAKVFMVTWGVTINDSEKFTLKYSDLILPYLGPIMRLLMPWHCIHYRLRLLAI